MKNIVANLESKKSESPAGFTREQFLALLEVVRGDELSITTRIGVDSSWHGKEIYKDLSAYLDSSRPGWRENPGLYNLKFQVNGKNIWLTHESEPELKTPQSRAAAVAEKLKALGY